MIAVVMYRVSGSVRMCSSLSQTHGHRIARNWTWLIMPSGVPFSRWSTIVKVSSVDELKRTIVEAWQKLPQSFIDKSVGEWHRRLEWLRSATAGGHIEHMFNWHVKCQFCVPVLFVFSSVIWCNKRTNYNAIRQLLRLLSFTRWRHFILQSWFK